MDFTPTRISPPITQILQSHVVTDGYFRPPKVILTRSSRLDPVEGVAHVIENPTHLDNPSAGSGDRVPNALVTTHIIAAAVDFREHPPYFEETTLHKPGDFTTLLGTEFVVGGGGGTTSGG